MISFIFRSASFLIYVSSLCLSFIIHHFYLLSSIKRYLSCFSFYIILISLLAINNLVLVLFHENITNKFQYILLFNDGLLTGALLALLVHIYTFTWCIFHLFLTALVLFMSRYCHLNKLQYTVFNDIILILINLIHIFYCFLNGFQTYMHRLVALGGMCTAFCIILFQQLTEELPIVITHFVQSIRAFFLYSLVICVRNRTSYW